jgi:hypothetical protein
MAVGIHANYLAHEPTEECRLLVSENKVLRRIGREQAIGGWKKLHHEEFYNMYWLPNIMR